MQMLIHRSQATVLALLLALGTTLTACGGNETADTDMMVEPGEGTTAQEVMEETVAVPSTATPPKPAQATTAPSKPSQPKSVEAAAAPEPACADCGTISSIEERTEKGKGTGMGAAAGAVLGAVAGREIVKGKRSHRDAAAVAGAIGGGYAGHKIEETARSTTYYVVTVRMDDNSTRTVNLESTEGLSVGQKVRVEGGNIILR